MSRTTPREELPREELIGLLEQGLDQGLSSGEWRRALDALATRGDAAEILAAVHRLAGAARDLRAACDAAPVPPDLEAGILRAMAAEAAPQRNAADAPAGASGLLGRLPGLLAAVRTRSAEAVRSVGQALTPGDLAAIAAARGPMAAPEPSLGASPANEASAPEILPLPPPGATAPSPAPAAAQVAAQVAVARDGVVRFGPGDGTRIVAEDAGPVAVDLGPLGPPAMGGWILHLERGAVAEEHEDLLTLTDEVEGLIVLPDGSVLAFGPVTHIRWD